MEYYSEYDPVGDIFGNLFWWIVIFSGLGVALKGAFWFLMSRGVMTSFQRGMFPWLYPPPTREDKDSSHKRIYAMSGLVIGVLVMIIGIIMVLHGLGGGEMIVEILGIGKISNVGPGLVLCFIGLGLIKYTKH